MRPVPLALAALLLLAATPPSRAQWFGPGEGWGGPARFGMAGFAPRPDWPAPRGFGPARFGGWGRPMWWRPMWWRQEARRRRFLAWRRWVALSEAPDAWAARPRRRTWRPRPAPDAVPVAAPEASRRIRTATPLARPAWQARALPAQSAAALAFLPVGSIRAATGHPVRPAPSLPAATLLRHLPGSEPAPVLRAGLPAAAPRHRALPSLRPAAAAASAPQPAVLRSDPAPSVNPIAAPAPAPGPAGDVPVAPLD